MLNSQISFLKRFQQQSKKRAAKISNQTYQIQGWTDSEDFKRWSLDFKLKISHSKIQGFLNDGRKNSCHEDREDSSNLSLDSIPWLRLGLTLGLSLWVTGGREGERMVAVRVPAEASDDPATKVSAHLISTGNRNSSRPCSWLTGAIRGNNVFGVVRPLAHAARLPCLCTANLVLRKAFTALFVKHSIVTVFALEAVGKAKKGSSQN